MPLRLVPLLDRRATLAIVSSALLGACSDSGSAERGAREERGGGAATTALPLVDRELTEAQRELLSLAFEAASSIPEHPHVKARARAQDEVVSTCLELDLPLSASRFLERVQGWRRGALHADLAHWCAVHSRPEDALAHLQLAQAYQDSPIGNAARQEWRRDRVRAKVARGYLALGRATDAQPFLVDLAESEQGIVALARAADLKAEDFDRQIRELDPLLQVGNFEQVKVALELCADLFRRFYDDVPKRELLEQRVRTGSEKLPFEIRIGLLQRLALAAIERNDLPKSRPLVASLQAQIDTAKWLPEDELRLRAELAALRFRAGEPVLAREDLDALLARYEREREGIIDIYRARALRAIAEAYLAQGDLARALAVYARAAEDGTANPNSLPRAEDFIATCCSIVRRGVEPDAELLGRLRRVREELGEPW
jgi:tetratricopeptide (TPR) repeat protein